MLWLDCGQASQSCLPTLPVFKFSKLFYVPAVCPRQSAMMTQPFGSMVVSSRDNKYTLGLKDVKTQHSPAFEPWATFVSVVLQPSLTHLLKDNIY